MPKDDAAPAADVTAAPVEKLPVADTGKPASGQVAADASAGADTEKQAPTSLATGADADDQVVVTQKWPEKWREEMAGGDKDSLKQLSRYDTPAGVWKKIKNLEKRLSEGSSPKIPDANADPEDVAAYRKAVGLAESPEKLLEAVKLPDGRLIGDDDKPIAESFAKAMVDVAPPQIMSKALQWYYDHMENMATQRIEQDEAYQVEGRKALKEEWGPGEFKRNINHLGTLFADAPEGLFDYMMSARGPDGQLLGNKPELIKFWHAKAMELNPHPSITTGGAPGSSLEGRITEIKEMRVKDADKYWSAAIQEELLNLTDARLKMERRSKAA